MSAVPTDQASELRRLMEATGSVGAGRMTRRTARFIAVASGKGGVGKTNIAVNLGLCLARRGLRVSLVDADLGTANADVVLNVQSAFNLAHVVRGERSVEDIAVRVEDGLRLIAGASGLAGVADLDVFERQRLVSELSLLERHADVVLVDCGAGISQNVLAFAHSADQLIVVTTPEPPSLTDAYALIKALSRAPQVPPMSVLANQVRSPEEGQGVVDRVTGVAARFLGIAVGDAGHVLRDDHVPLAVRQRVPFVVRYPRCPASGCVAALAERVDHVVCGREARPNFFGRVLRFFY